jgi:Velvet factor
VVSPIYTLSDLDGSTGAFALFPHLSIRVCGRFRLKYTLSYFNRDQSSVPQATHVSSVVSEPFDSTTFIDWNRKLRKTLVSLLDVQIDGLVGRGAAFSPF